MEIRLISTLDFISWAGEETSTSFLGAIRSWWIEYTGRSMPKFKVFSLYLYYTSSRTISRRQLWRSDRFRPSIFFLGPEKKLRRVCSERAGQHDSSTMVSLCPNSISFYTSPPSKLVPSLIQSFRQLGLLRPPGPLPRIRNGREPDLEIYQTAIRKTNKRLTGRINITNYLIIENLHSLALCTNGFDQREFLLE